MCIRNHCRIWELVVRKTSPLAAFCLLFVAVSSTLNVVRAERITAAPVWLEQPMTLADARHLLQRTGFGAAPAELARFTGITRAQAVQDVIDALGKRPHIAMPDWVDAPAPHYWTRRFLSPSKRQSFNRARDKELVDLRRWWVNNMLQTDSPQTERLVLFWHDHFATSYQGVDRRSMSIGRQNKLFREMGTGSYRALLKAIIRDPAMLLYLDNQSNRKGKPNENLARELLELFSLGEGNFTEESVKEAARALTGYGFSETSNHSFRLYGYKQDLEQKTLFNQTGNYDGDDLINLILEQAAAAEHLVQKFWHGYVSDEAPDPVFVKTLSQSFRDSDYDLTELYAAVISSEAFWNESNRLSLIKSPATLLIGTARSLDYPKRAWTQMPSLHALLGMDLFAPPNVAGWTEGVAFVAPGRLLNRQLAMQTVLSVPGTRSSADHGAVDRTVAAGKGMSNNMMNAMMNVKNENTNQSTASMQSDIPVPMQVRVAGHFYRGAPNFKVSLHDAYDVALWESDVRTLTIGYDTEMFGDMRDLEQLAWQTANFTPPASALSNSSVVKVEFLNDAAGKTGDRNLFIESVSINGRTYSSEGAVQASGCPPNNRRDAGNLYCAGSLSIDVSDRVVDATPRDADFTATDANVIWSNRKKHKLDAIITLEHVQTPQHYFHTVSFHVQSKNAKHLEISLDAYNCWPDCFQRWPACAWQDDRTKEQNMVFPLRRGQNAETDCHYDSITQSEQQLINAIYASLPSLIDVLRPKAKKDRQQRILQRWQQRIDGLADALDNSVYLRDASVFHIDTHYSKPGIRSPALPEPRIVIDNLPAFAQIAADVNLSITELLIGGAPIRHFPELQFESSVPAEVQLEKLLAHPVYQVY